MTKRYTKLTIIALLSLSLGTSQLSAKGRSKGILRKTKDTTVSYTQKASAVAAEVTDYCLYPVMSYILGSFIYDGIVSEKMPTSRSYTKYENKVPMAPTVRRALVRLVVGTLALNAAHSGLQTKRFGSFMKTRMPRLTKLVNHIHDENEEVTVSKKRRAL